MDFLSRNARAIALSTLAVIGLGLTAILASADSAQQTPPGPPTAVGKYFKPQEVMSTGSVTVEGANVPYNAVAGTLIVHPEGWEDVKDDDKANKDKNPDAEASMFYVAYFKRGADSSRPITFIYNGGPGSSTVWLHMGAFGPRRIMTAEDTHTPAAPYHLVDNAYSLLDASDLVFIDAPGTGFSRIAGKDKEKAFYGVDPDAHAFAEFITSFLSRWQRWNSPKYLFGESYGTPRSAVLVNELETDHDVDFNGVILLSQILSFDLGPDGPSSNPGVDLSYQLSLPTYAATAWYHHMLPKPVGDLVPFLRNVERFAMTDYALALQAGNSLDDRRRATIAEKLHEYTGLPVWYIQKANLRIDGGEFEKNLEGQSDVTTGRLDTRFSGPTLDPLSERADYDPQSAALSSAYVSALNDYARTQLKFGMDTQYRPQIRLFQYWNFEHKQPDQGRASSRRGSNVIPDLANAMKYNPDLKVLLNGGYFDLATPYYQGWYEMHHLPIPPALQKNLEFHYYQSGHMVYAHEESLKELHDTVADFIRRTDNVK